MMNKKALIPLTLAVMLALGSAGNAIAGAAAQRADVRYIHIASATVAPKPTATSPLPEYSAPEGLPKVLSVSGTIADITGRDDGSKLVTLTHEEGGETHFIVNPDTYIVPGGALEVGAAFTGWFDATLPMTLQYPPRYTALAARVGGGEDLSVVKIDIFDEDRLSSDGELKLNITEDAVVIDRDGNAYDGELDGRLLAVTYTFSTRSIPAQTSPERIVVLDGAVK